jgi:hypothetical protein
MNSLWIKPIINPYSRIKNAPLWPEVNVGKAARPFAVEEN